MPEDAVKNSIKLLRRFNIDILHFLAISFVSIISTAFISYRIEASGISKHYVDLMALGIYIYRQKGRVGSILSEIFFHDFVAVAFVILALGGIYWALRNKIRFDECIIYSAIVLPLAMDAAFLFASKGTSFIKVRGYGTLREYKDAPKGLKQRILKTAKDSGVDPESIYVAPGGMLNAFACGGLRFKWVVICSGLFQALSDDQIMAVVMHELGHLSRMHSVSGFTLHIVLNTAILMSGIYIIRGMHKRSYDLFLILMVYDNVLGLLSMVLRLFFNVFCSQKMEYAADLNACRHGHGRDLIESLRIFAITGAQGEFFDLTKIFNTLSTHPATLKRFNAVWDYLAGK